MNLAEAKTLGLARPTRKRVGRGPGSGNGKTAGRGHNGARSRSGWSSRIGWEGGQMPLYRRLPKRGFNNKNFEKVYTVVNVSDLEVFDAGATVDLAAVLAKGLTSQAKRRTPRLSPSSTSQPPPLPFHWQPSRNSLLCLQSASTRRKLSLPKAYRRTS